MANPHLDDFDNRNRLMSNREDTNSDYCSKSYALSRNMLQSADMKDWWRFGEGGTGW